MKKIVLILSLLIICVTSAQSQYRVMGFYPQGTYGDFIIVYGYYAADGKFRMSHCRTNAVGQDIYSNRSYLDINTCTIKMLPTNGDPSANGI